MRHALLLIALLVTTPIFAQNPQFDLAGNLVLLSNGATGPASLREPVSRLARPGARVSFSVSASGSGLSFRWYFNGALVPGVLSDTLLITNASSLNVGDYYVVASNSRSEEHTSELQSLTNIVCR